MTLKEMTIEQLLNEEFRLHSLPDRLSDCTPDQEEGWNARSKLRGELLSRNAIDIIAVCVARGNAKRAERAELERRAGELDGEI
jgi:hypothetical protein